MKKEGTKKKNWLLWVIIAAVALLAVAGTVLALVLGGGQEEKTPVGRPELYWNLDKDSYTSPETGLSTREPAEDGLYHMRFAYEGQVCEYTVADKQLVNYIDTFNCVSLVFDRDGSVIDAVDVRDVATEIGKEVYVRYYRNDTLYVNTSVAMNGMTLMLDVTDLTKIYNVSADADPLGGILSPEDLQPMDCVTIYGNELEQSTHVYLQSKPEKSPVYWRVKAQYDSATQGTARTPDATGAYSIDFYCDGEIVTLKCRDKKIVDYVDYKSDYKAHFGFVFDEEGYIVKRVESQIGIQARCVGEGYDVTYIDDVEIELTSQIWSNAGDVEVFKVEDDTVIYDVSKAAYAEGRQGRKIDSLQLGDRVVVWLDTENDAVLVYVTERLVDSPMYYNVTRKYSASKGESTRTPNADGWYEVELAVNGEVKTFKTKDKAKIDYLDSFSPRGLGLKVENGNEIVYVYHANCVYGQKYFCDGRYVTSANSGLAQLWSRPQDKTYNCVLDPSLKVYDMSGVGELGSETTLQVGDNVLAYQKPTGELVCIYVQRRAYEGAGFYWNLSRKYDSTTKQTTRQPDENGWYVFQMAMGGKTVTVKTQSKAMATKIDAFSPGAVGLVVNSGGVVLQAFDAKNVYGGNQLTSGTYVSAINSDGTFQTYSLKSGKYLDMTLAEDCKIYNISAAYVKEKGETTTLKMGDMVTVYANIKNEAAIIIVRSRETDGMYWKQDRFYDSTNKVTTRVPDAEGWYVYNLAVNGTVKTLKTKDVEIASKVDATESGFGLLLKGDEILRYVSAAYVKDVNTDGVINWDVVSVNGREVTVKYNRDGSENTGVTKTITLASDAKIMDVSANVESFGAYTKLQPGDRIRTYVNSDDQHLYVWVKYRGMREKGMEGYCDHCGKTVTWDPYVGSSLPKIGGHYYLVQDVTTKSQTNVGSDELDYEVVLDLNGKTLTRDNGRAILVYKGDKLTVLDSVGGGEIRSTGSSAGHGGVLMISGGAEVTLMSGTLRAIEGESRPAYGGIVSVSGKGTVFRMEGGKLADGVTEDNEKYTARGGGIYCSAATVDISGGSVEGGSATQGGGIYLAGNAIANITGGTLSGGKALSYGGNVYVSTNAQLNLSGGKLTGGIAKYGANVAVLAGEVNLFGGELADGAAKLYGGNLYAKDGSAVAVSGGKISGGTAGDYAGNIYFTTSGACKLDITGGEIAGDVRINGAESVSVSGAPIIGTGSEGGLDMRNGVVLTVGQLQQGAQIAISNTGAFTGTLENAESYVPYFCTAKEGGTVYAKDGVLYATSGAIRFADCQHCGQNVMWTQWEKTAYPGSGHYYLTENVDMERTRVNIGTSSNKDVDIVLDLNGNAWTTGDNRAFWVYGSFAVMDTVGGGEIVANGSNMGSGGVMRVDGSLTLYSGTIRRNVSESLVGKGGVLQLTSGSEFVMKGGKLTGGTCVSYTDSNDKVVDAHGGTIYAEDATIRMEGGTIEGGSAASGGNLYLANTVFEMTDGLITGGISEGNGGNIFSSGKTAVTVTGGSITGGTAGDSGADYHANNAKAILTVRDAHMGQVRVKSAAAVTLGGKTVIDSLILNEGVKLTLEDLAADTSIGITATGAFTQANENAKAYLDAGYFMSIPTDQTISEENGVLIAETVPAGAVKRECAHCGEAVWFTPWEKANNPTSGHYYLADHINMERTRVNIGTSSNKAADIVLDLNGLTWTTGDNRAFWVYGDFAVMDSVGGGEIVANGSNMGSGGVMRVDGSLTLYGGTIRRNVSDSLVGKGGILNLTSGASFIMKGGKLTGGTCVSYQDGSNATVSAQGGSIYADGATVRLEGGSIENGTAASGGNIYLKNATFEMNGGTVTGGEVTTNGGNIFMETSTMIMSGGTIENGIAGNRGGNILLDKECSFTVSGGTIKGGQAAKQGGNIRLNYSSTDVKLTGGTIYGDMTVFSAKSFTLSGSPKILMGNSAGLILGDGIDPSAGNANLKLTLENLNTDAEIYISAVGEITDGPAAEYLNCFKGALRTTVAANAGTGILEATQGTTGYCPHCWQNGLAATWTDAAQIGKASSGAYTKLSENAHYYLTEDITRSGNGSRLNIGGTASPDVDIVIDLSGYNWTATNNRVAQVFAHLTVMDSLCDGVMTGGTAGAEPYSSVATVNLGTASLQLYSGTLRGAAGVDACVINCNKGNFYMYGGYVVGSENATKDTVILGTNGAANYLGGLVDGVSKKEEPTDE